MRPVGEWWPIASSHLPVWSGVGQPFPPETDRDSQLILPGCLGTGRPLLVAGPVARRGPWSRRHSGPGLGFEPTPIPGCGVDPLEWQPPQ